MCVLVCVYAPMECVSTYVHARQCVSSRGRVFMRWYPRALLKVSVSAEAVDDVQSDDTENKESPCLLFFRIGNVCVRK